MRMTSLSRTAAAIGMTMAAVALAAAPSYAFGAPAGSLGWLVGSRGANFVCHASALRKVPLVAKLPYLSRLQQEDPVEQQFTVSIRPDGSLQGSDYYNSEDACSLDVPSGQLVLDQKTGTGTARFDISAGNKVSENSQLPCMGLLGGRRVFAEKFKVVLLRESRLTADVQFDMLGEQDFSHAVGPGHTPALVPVSVHCTEQITEF